MRRRITTAIIGVTAIVLLALGIPLAIAVQRSILQSEVVDLQAQAARTLAEVSTPLEPAELAEVDRLDQSVAVAIYDADGRMIAGHGPPSIDDAISRALSGTPSTTTQSELVVATPITAGSDDNIIGVLRLAESRREATQRTWLAWGIMGGAALAALGVAWAIATRVAGRIARPVNQLAALAVDIGHGRAVETPPPVGIAELDALGATLVDSSQRVHEALARERRFSADVSHQLRTPLTHLRLTLERVQQERDTAAVAASLDDLDRIDATVDHLLAFARESMPIASAVDLNDPVRGAAARWSGPAARKHRLIRTIETAGPAIAHCTNATIDQTLDVLIDNALRHGTGTITVEVRTIAGGVAIDVRDEDNSVNLTEDIFERHTTSDHGHGIGLALARSIIEADGGRLLLTKRRPSTFSILMVGTTP